MNKLLGGGKRWMPICLLLVVIFVMTFVIVSLNKSSALYAPRFESSTRRQVIGDAAIIDRGIRTGWEDVFPEEGERFLASFAIPGVEPAIRNTSEAEIKAALARRVNITPADHIEARQIKSMVEGVKDELRQFLSDGGSIMEYGGRLVARQEEEIRYHKMAVAEVRVAQESKMQEGDLLALWERINKRLRAMGIMTVPYPEMSN